MIEKVCPYCEKVTSQEAITVKEEYKIRNEPITVNSTIYKCACCGEELDGDNDPLEKAYRAYREHKGLIQPEDIAMFRQKYDLTQKELSHMLGFGAVTLSRYENGALQTDAHNVSLEMAMQPASLRMLVEKNRSLFSQQKYQSLIQLIDSEYQNLYCGNSGELTRQLEHNSVDEFSGFTGLNVQKMIEVIIFMCQFDGALKTILNKLMFYSDFYVFKDKTRSLTGLKYVHLPYGPVPDNFDFVYAQLVKDKYLEKVEDVYPNGYVGERFIATRSFDSSLFDKDEIDILNKVKEKFSGYTAKAITDYSHEEQAYKKTHANEGISYLYACDLSDF
ncbi:type II TA system antitoxin MqsA family protein [Vibrio diazotrophicus]|uniref:type II TA system antitoxin MqsA family protein n=1 Tax=Vibrio diazotrophicus TaxID=685 RepID=UPI0005AB8F2A|nr:type II TA system antitoxin MqsA family protein [Vibrio diazotrophicus]